MSVLVKTDCPSETIQFDYTFVMETKEWLRIQYWHFLEGSKGELELDTTKLLHDCKHVWEDRFPNGEYT